MTHTPGTRVRIIARELPEYGEFATVTGDGSEAPYNLAAVLDGNDGAGLYYASEVEAVEDAPHDSRDLALDAIRDILALDPPASGSAIRAGVADILRLTGRAL